MIILIITTATNNNHDQNTTANNDNHNDKTDTRHPDLDTLLTRAAVGVVEGMARGSALPPLSSIV